MIEFSNSLFPVLSRYAGVYTTASELDAMARRELYNADKTGAAKELRAMAKKQNMDMMGIPSSYRWDNEQDANVKIHSE